MSADTLRRAAALMRERAEALYPLHPSPWEAAEDSGQSRTPSEQRVLGDHHLVHDRSSVIVPVPGFRSERTAIADHIASWHPTVALAVADWLEAEAGSLEAIDQFSNATASLVKEHKYEVRGAAMTVSLKEDGSIGINADTSKQALAVARAYLGGDS